MEAELVALTFYDRSSELELAPVVALTSSMVEMRLVGAVKPKPSTREPISARELEQEIRAGARKSGVELVELELLKPRGWAPAFTLRVSDPPEFLLNRTEGLLEALQVLRRTDGFFLRLVDNEGEFVWLYGAIFGSVGHSIMINTRRGLEGCDRLLWSMPMPLGRERPPCHA